MRTDAHASGPQFFHASSLPNNIILHKGESSITWRRSTAISPPLSWVGPKRKYDSALKQTRQLTPDESPTQRKSWSVNNTNVAFEPHHNKDFCRTGRLICKITDFPSGKPSILALPASTVHMSKFTQPYGFRTCTWRSKIEGHAHCWLCLVEALF